MKYSIPIFVIAVFGLLLLWICDAPKKQSAIALDRKSLYEIFQTPLGLTGTEKSEVFSQYVLHRQIQIANDLERLNATGEIPSNRSLGINLENINLLDINISDLNLSGANFAHANLKNAEIQDSLLNRASFDYANLDGLTISSTDISQTSFMGANLKNSKFNNIQWNKHTVFFLANIEGMSSEPKGLKAHALATGAVTSTDEWKQKITQFKSALNPP